FRRKHGSEPLALLNYVKNFTPEYPNLDTDLAVSGLCFRDGIINVGAQSVQRHTSFHVALDARHVRTAQTTGALDLNALGSGLNRLTDGLLHRATERHATLQLLLDAVSENLGFQVRLLDFEHVEDRLARRDLADLRQLFFQALGACAL